MTATSARNARSTSVAAVSPGTEKTIQCARKAIINMAACDEIKLKLAGEGYGAYPKIINRNKADKKGIFCAGLPQKKLCAKVQISNGLQQDQG